MEHGCRTGLINWANPIEIERKICVKSTLTRTNGNFEWIFNPYVKAYVYRWFDFTNLSKFIELFYNVKGQGYRSIFSRRKNEVNKIKFWKMSRDVQATLQWWKMFYV